MPKKNTTRLSIEKYNATIQKVKAARMGLSVQNKHWLLSHYDVLNVSGKDHLIFPMVNNQILYYVPTEQVFDILYDAHESLCHGGRDRMRKELLKRYKNISLREIQIFLNMCEQCLQKRKCDKKDLAVKPTDLMWPDDDDLSLDVD